MEDSSFLYLSQKRNFKMLKNFNISAHFIFDRIAEKYYENKVSGSGFKFFFVSKMQ